MNKDTIIIILSYLDAQTIIECSLINRQFNHVITNEHLWRLLCDRDYPKEHETVRQETFYETYKLCYGLTNLKWIDCDETYNPSINHKYNSKRYKNSYPKSDKTGFPQVICKLKNLEELLYATHQHILSVPKEIFDLTNLQRLTIHNVDMQTFPDGVEKLRNLTYIDLSTNQLTEFPIGICQIIRLRTVDLHANQIKEVPEEMVQLVNLETLNLSWNSIKTVSKRMHTMINLKYIDLSHNKLTKIPDFVWRARNLVHASFKENRIKIRIDL